MKRIPRTLGRFLLTTAIFASAIPFAASGDVLVTREGSRIEIEGTWEVRGRQVLFKPANGTLSALRLADVDLEASEEATRLAKNPPPPESASAAKKAPQREAVLVLTNESLGLGPEGVGTTTAEDGRDGGRESASSVTTEGDVRLVEWSYTPAGEDPVYEVTGLLENRGAVPAEDVSVFLDIVAVDEETGVQQPDRHLLRKARVQVRNLEPGALTEFTYPVSEKDLQVHGEEGFSDPVVSFDIQFRPGEAPDGDLEEDGSGEEAESSETSPLGIEETSDPGEEEAGLLGVQESELDEDSEEEDP